MTLTYDSTNSTQVKYHLNSTLQLTWEPKQHATLALVHPDCTSTPLLDSASNLEVFVQTLRKVSQGSILIGVAESVLYGEHLDNRKIVQKLWPERGSFVAFTIITGNYGASKGYAFPYQDQTWWNRACFCKYLTCVAEHF